MSKRMAITTVAAVLSASAIAPACDKGGSGSAGTAGVNRNTLNGQALRGTNGNNNAANNPTLQRAQQQQQQRQKKIADAQQGVTDANSALAQAESNYNSTWTQIKSQFESSTEYQAAVAEQTQAQVAYDAARSPILTKLQDNQEYVSQMNLKSNLQEQLRALEENPTLDLDRGAVAKEALSHGSAAHKIEAQLLASDPAVSTAKDKLTQAGAKVASLRSEFQSTFASNTQFQAAKQTLDAAKSKQAAAKSTLSREQQLASLDQQNLQTALASASNGHEGSQGMCHKQQ